MQHITFQQKLENRIGNKLRVKINDNRSTMLSVRWEPECTKVSLHRMFLQAPRNVMEALACYLRGDDKNIAPTVRAFIEENLPKLDYSHQIPLKSMHVQGNVYNLQEIYDEINQIYFAGKLNLHITWFGKLRQRNRTTVTFGLYYDPLKLIKIHRLMDSPLVPRYVISYIMYHEMVHHVCPAYVDQNGLSRVHSKEFKEREEQFRHFHLAQKWIKMNQNNLFANLD